VGGLEAGIAVAAVFFLAAGCLGQLEAELSPKPQVTLDVMYADWCGHCSDMKAVVEGTVAKMPSGSVKVNYWNEKLRAIDPQTAAIYKRYKDGGKFRGFPTIVADGNDALVGYEGEAEFTGWLCKQFYDQPFACFVN
jgi:hypothetical protein